ncbi:MAG: VOC family protein [Candidatus Limnocylindrales bacterium]
MAKHGEYNHLELPADDIDRARAFYEAVFGWQTEAMPGMADYYLFRAGEGRGGGIGTRGKTAPNTSRLYVQVDSIDAALAAAGAHGGRTGEPKTAIQGMGSYAVLADSEGSEPGHFEAEPGA